MCLLPAHHEPLQDGVYSEAERAIQSSVGEDLIVAYSGIGEVALAHVVL